jgi:tRNA G37 N-methylase Trm5
VAIRTSSLQTEFRSAGQEGITILAGRHRSPMVTAHTEYGIKCVIDLEQCFFSNRMGPERIRLCQQVARGERVLVLFSGVGMEALQLAGRTEAKEVIAIEKNPVAAECARRGAAILLRNKRLPCAGAFDRLTFIEGDVMDVLQNTGNTDNLAPSSFEPASFDRILAPRPKEGKLDGDLGTGDAGVPFLELIIPLLRPDGGECHWYDFCADHEFPKCERTRATIEGVCRRLGCEMEVINVANAGSVAKRQLRVCMDFRIISRDSV